MHRRCASLLRRQLPQVNQRLQRTLDKLDQGAQVAQSTDSAGHWWRDLQQRYAHERVVFEADPLPPELEIPADLFDRVAENCLQNALEKRRAAPQVEIRVRLSVEAGLQLTICDSGEALQEALARTLFTAPVPSRQGFGVGLYQAARQASALGYRLALESNRFGEVCFMLKHCPQPAVTADDLPPRVG